MFYIYQIIVSILIILSPLIIFYRILKSKEDKKRFIEKFSINTKTRIKGNLVWFHGASVGEILSVLPIIKIYENKKSIDQILVTTSTLSSSNIIEKIKLKKTIHQFYPIDHFYFTNKFLKYWQPNIAIFIESEIWPSMFKEIKLKNIPLILLNARLTKKTFNNWIKIKKFSKTIFNKITIAYPQNTETTKFLKKLSNVKIKKLGNLKFSESYESSYSKLNQNLKFELNKKKIWVASSTHKSEEIFCIKTHMILKDKVKNLMTIIIPRHIHRVDEILDEIKNYNLNIALHSTKPKTLRNVEIYIVDTFGETKKFHKIASSVFLGGSLIKRGGQNPLEAARYGANIFHGKNVDNFKDVYKLLKSLKVSKITSSPNELASLITFKRKHYTAIKLKNIGEKILKKTIKELENFIKNEFKKT